MACQSRVSLERTSNDRVVAQAAEAPSAGSAGPAKTEPAKTEPAKTEPAKTEPAKTEPVKTEPVKTELVKTEEPEPEVIASPAPSDPKEVADPRPLIFRHMRYGFIINRMRTTSILRRAGNKASVRVIKEGSAPGTSPYHAGPSPPRTWEVVSVETFVGTMRQDGKLTRFDLASAAGRRLKLACRNQRIDIHREGAELINTPNRPHDESADLGVWRPSAVQRIDVLACAEKDEYFVPVTESAEQYERTLLMLGPLPGVELLSINNDDPLQGSGYRHLPPWINSGQQPAP
jgi:hypothetical protein